MRAALDDLAGFHDQNFVRVHHGGEAVRNHQRGLAARHAAQPGEVALAWLMARPGVTAPIASASNVAQVEGLVRATQLQLSADDVEALDAASAPEAA